MAATLPSPHRHSAPLDRLVDVAVPVPLRHTYQYLVRDLDDCIQRGGRVRVPFGKRLLIGIVLNLPAQSRLARTRLKHVETILDREPVVSSTLLALLQWAANYYQHSIGEVIQAALPRPVRKGRPLQPTGVAIYNLSENGHRADHDQLHRAPLQQTIMCHFQRSANGSLTATDLQVLSPNWRGAVERLLARGWLELGHTLPAHASTEPTAPGVSLSSDQAKICGRVRASMGGYCCFLLHGVTGSGKTEIYMEAVRSALDAGRQALVLVPEIGLTPQSIDRFRKRFGVPIAVLHSGLADGDRHKAWWMTRNGIAPIVLGTRSAVFAPLAKPGLIVVDEEHDSSYKQQDGFRYHARDVAIKRASLEGIPIILGSATPSLESFANARARRYDLLSLPDRPGRSNLPGVQLIDLTKVSAQDGLTPPMLKGIASRVGSGEQSLIFINRRGFAPVLLCRECDWLAECGRCDAKLTLHAGTRVLRCHHCGAEQPLPSQCPGCGKAKLYKVGHGTQRLEAALSREFPEARILRIDRDTTLTKGAMEDKLEQIHHGEADILVGTQMLSKGHDFPAVTLVGIVDVDQGIFSVDFRSPERLFQLVTQVSGRAGRAGKPGQVLVQTRFPHNPYFEMMRRHDYLAFAQDALLERRQAGLPPYAYLAMLRAESVKPGTPIDFLQKARGWGTRILESQKAPVPKLMDPVPSPMERRAGRYRAQLLVKSSGRSQMQLFLPSWVGEIEANPASRQVRWSIDVDPMEMY